MRILFIPAYPSGWGREAAVSSGAAARWHSCLFVIFLSSQQDVEKFTDIEKLYLYLKLPSGPSSGNDKRCGADTRCTLLVCAPLPSFFCLSLSLSPSFAHTHTHKHTRGCFVMALITFLALLSHCLSQVQVSVRRSRHGFSRSRELLKIHKTKQKKLKKNL